MSRNLSELRCPECKKQNISHIDEIWDGNILRFEVECGKVAEQGVIGDYGAPVRLIATCGDCMHEWVIRGAKQIIEIEAERFVQFLHRKENAE
ncbi:TPA: hypothetical protein ACPVZG_004150 [Vibrio parahaemolyticus]